MRGNFNTLTELAEEVTRQEEAKKDLIVSPDNLKMMPDGETFQVGEHSFFSINEHCHGQVSSKTGIPKRYYDSMAVMPELRAQNVNAWLGYQSKNHLVRTLDGRARALLSDKFMPIDNYHILNEAFLPVVLDYKKEQGSGEIKIVSNCLSEQRMYVQVVFPSIQAEIKVGDIVQAGISLRNSEVGAGALDIESLVWRLNCSNGMISGSLLKKYHVGRRINIEDEGEINIYSRETISADLHAWKLRIRDVIKHALTGAVLQKMVAKIQASTDDVIEKPQSLIENVTKKFGFSEKEGESILANMMSEGENTRYGLLNGVTHLAHEIENLDRQYEVEKIGNQIIELSPREWRVLNEAT